MRSLSQLVLFAPLLVRVLLANSDSKDPPLVNLDFPLDTKVPVPTNFDISLDTMHQNLHDDFLNPNRSLVLGPASHKPPNPSYSSPYMAELNPLLASMLTTSRESSYFSDLPLPVLPESDRLDQTTGRATTEPPKMPLLFVNGAADQAYLEKSTSYEMASPSIVYPIYTKFRHSSLATVDRIDTPDRYSPFHDSKRVYTVTASPFTDLLSLKDNVHSLQTTSNTIPSFQSQITTAARTEWPLNPNRDSHLVKPQNGGLPIREFSRSNNNDASNIVSKVNDPWRDLIEPTNKEGVMEIKTFSTTDLDLVEPLTLTKPTVTRAKYSTLPFTLRATLTFPTNQDSDSGLVTGYARTPHDVPFIYRPRGIRNRRRSSVLSPKTTSSQNLTVESSFADPETSSLATLTFQSPMNGFQATLNPLSSLKLVSEIAENDHHVSLESSIVAHSSISTTEVDPSGVSSIATMPALAQVAGKYRPGLITNNAKNEEDSPTLDSIEASAFPVSSDLAKDQELSVDWEVVDRNTENPSTKTRPLLLFDWNVPSQEHANDQQENTIPPISMRPEILVITHSSMDLQRRKDNIDLSNSLSHLSMRISQGLSRASPISSPLLQHLSNNKEISMEDVADGLTPQARSSVIGNRIGKASRPSHDGFGQYLVGTVEPVDWPPPSRDPEKNDGVQETFVSIPINIFSKSLGPSLLLTPRPILVAALEDASNQILPQSLDEHWNEIRDVGAAARVQNANHRQSSSSIVQTVAQATESIAKNGREKWLEPTTKSRSANRGDTGDNNGWHNEYGVGVDTEGLRDIYSGPASELPVVMNAGEVFEDGYIGVLRGEGNPNVATRLDAWRKQGMRGASYFPKYVGNGGMQLTPPPPDFSGESTYYSRLYDAGMEILAERQRKQAAQKISQSVPQDFSLKPMEQPVILKDMVGTDHGELGFPTASSGTSSHGLQSRPTVRSGVKESESSSFNGKSTLVSSLNTLTVGSPVPGISSMPLPTIKGPIPPQMGKMAAMNHRPFALSSGTLAGESSVSAAPATALETRYATRRYIPNTHKVMRKEHSSAGKSNEVDRISPPKFHPSFHAPGPARNDYGKSLTARNVDEAMRMVSRGLVGADTIYVYGSNTILGDFQETFRRDGARSIAYTQWRLCGQGFSRNGQTHYRKAVATRKYRIPMRIEPHRRRATPLVVGRGFRHDVARQFAVHAEFKIENPFIGMLQWHVSAPANSRRVIWQSQQHRKCEWRASGFGRVGCHRWGVEIEGSIEIMTE